MCHPTRPPARGSRHESDDPIIAKPKESSRPIRKISQENNVIPIIDRRESAVGAVAERRAAATRRCLERLRRPRTMRSFRIGRAHWLDASFAPTSAKKHRSAQAINGGYGEPNELLVRSEPGCSVSTHHHNVGPQQVSRDDHVTFDFHRVRNRSTSRHHATGIGIERQWDVPPVFSRHVRGSGRSREGPSTPSHRAMLA